MNERRARIGNQLDEGRERNGQQQSHDSPQPAPEQHANGHRHGSDQKTRADQLGNQIVLGDQMKKNNGDCNGDEGPDGVELEESSRQRNRGGQQDAKEGDQIQKRAHDPQRHGSLHSEN